MLIIILTIVKTDKLCFAQGQKVIQSHNPPHASLYRWAPASGVAEANLSVFYIKGRHTHTRRNTPEVKSPEENKQRLCCGSPALLRA